MIIVNLYSILKNRVARNKYLGVGSRHTLNSRLIVRLFPGLPSTGKISDSNLWAPGGQAQEAAEGHS